MASTKMVDEKSGEVLFIISDVNLGFAKGCNVGISLAVTMDAELVFLLNSDAVVHKDSIQKIVTAFQTVDKNCGLGPVIYDFSPIWTESIQNSGGAFNWDRFPCYTMKRLGEIDDSPKRVFLNVIG